MKTQYKGRITVRGILRPKLRKRQPATSMITVPRKADIIVSVKLKRRVVNDDVRGGDALMRLVVETSHGNKHEVDVKAGVLLSSRQAALVICGQLGKYADDKGFLAQLDDLRSAPAIEVRTTQRSGWKADGAFVLPHASYGQTKGRYEFDLTNDPSGPVGLGSIKGTLAEWKAEVASKLALSTAGVTLAGVAFCSPLLAFSSVAEPWMVLISGKSSTGKSSLLAGGASIQGAPFAMITGADSSLQGLHETGERHNDQLMPIGDLSHLTDGDRRALMRKLTYDVTQGKSRTISASVRSKIRPRDYKTNPVATFEHNSTVIAKQGRIDYLLGETVRCFDFPSPDEPTGHFDQLPVKDRRHSAEVAESLAANANRFYGTAGDAWLTWLVDQDNDWLRSKIDKTVKAFQGRMLGQNAEAVQVRAAQKFGLMLAGLKLAKRAGVIDWSDKLMTKCVSDSFSAAMEITGRRTPESARQQFIAAMSADGSLICPRKKQTLRKCLARRPGWVALETTRKGRPVIGVWKKRMRELIGDMAYRQAVDLLVADKLAADEPSSGVWLKNLPDGTKCRLLEVSLDISNKR